MRPSDVRYDIGSPRGTTGRQRVAGRRSCFASVRPALALLLILGPVLFWSASAWAQAPFGIDITFNGDEVEPSDVSLTLQILFLLTILTIAPGIIVMTTAFTRIIIVLSFLRRALGTQTTPSNQVLIGLSMFMTFFIMAPVWERMNQEAIQPYLAGQFEAYEEEIVLADGETATRQVLPFEQMARRALQPLRDFMWSQVGLSSSGPSDVALFMNMAGLERPSSREDVPTHVLIPAFIIGELKKSFIMGFLIFMPFLIIDMVTASVLMSMGMMMLPPILISLPFKILLFVMVDGWALLAYALGMSFAGG